MKSRVFSLSLAAIFTFAATVSCEKETFSRAERLAAQSGRDEAIYKTRDIEETKETVLAWDISGIERPGGPGEFIQIHHGPPVRQGRTGTCWSFATTSLLESELRRLGKADVKLSELHTVYWEYVEKARRFIREKGASFIGQGSEPNSALERLKTYGIVRDSDYSGLPPGRTGHDHGALFGEVRAFLDGMRSREDWNEQRGLEGVRSILDRHLGRPPETISIAEVRMTPQEYLKTELGLDPGSYVSFISFKYLPFYTKGEFRVPDNWWHSGDYLNLPLYEFHLTLLKALRRGYTAVLSVDFSEPGYVGEDDIAVVPSFDIPRNFIDQSSRELRFDNGTTTDDHAVHCVGYRESTGSNWFLIKDSWENAYWGRHKGYFFYRDDFVKLKVLMFMVHKDGVREILEKFPSEER